MKKPFFITTLFTAGIIFSVNAQQAAASSTAKTNIQQSAEAKMAAQKSIAPHPIEKKEPRRVHIATPTANTLKVKPGTTGQGGTTGAK